MRCDMGHSEAGQARELDLEDSVQEATRSTGERASKDWPKQ